MKRLLILAVVPALILTACAVVPKPPPDQAIPMMSFAELVAEAGQYKGKLLTLGGSVLEVVNLKSQTRIEALQIPLGVGQKPKNKDYAQGRLILIKDGFLDPEVYTKGRLVTVSGTLLGSSKSEDSQEPYPYLRVKVDELHLWPVEKPRPPEPYWDPFWYPFPFWWRHPHHW